MDINISELKSYCSQIRRDIVRMVHAQSSGHPGGSLGCVEFFYRMDIYHLYFMQLLLEMDIFQLKN